MSWIAPEPVSPAASAEFRRLVTGMINEYPYLEAVWDSSLEEFIGPVVRLRGPDEDGPVLCLILAGNAQIGVSKICAMRASPYVEGWQQCVCAGEDLADLIYEFARAHCAG